MRIKDIFKASIYFLLLACVYPIFYFNSGKIMFSSNMQKGIERFWRNKLSIKEVKDFEAYSKKFELILSTPVNNGKYKYLNCYEEKMNGLYYKSYQASEQGGSNALINFSTVFVNRAANSNAENYFTIVYGYNKDFQVDSYEVKISGQEKNIILNISGKEYFIDVYKGKFQNLVNAKGKDGSDMISYFCD